jgi:hypothetical protein
MRLSPAGPSLALPRVSLLFSMFHVRFGCSQDSPSGRLGVHTPACSPSRRRPASTPARPPVPTHSCKHLRLPAVYAADSVAEVFGRLVLGRLEQVAVDGALDEAGAAGLDHGRDELVHALPCRTRGMASRRGGRGRGRLAAAPRAGQHRTFAAALRGASIPSSERVERVSTLRSGQLILGPRRMGVASLYSPYPMPPA